ncbi:right-handed parallel beta-helix repeat-containing protein [Dyadobacter sp. CY323]|uniref:right-handed parallel beta-helix repeat-containing protein n=1 Tax=Dyadobacter sp. CY323 TaxID=2907302 RepID=UPI001F42393B|nr:right-handed parallel beta-helix repeat-containing protein [Dyadobacter sp. CY323]MCE6991382.1 right-handed parallel beta-helix repeat-containing protein [Dyadobacter sp. CY323]
MAISLFNAWVITFAGFFYDSSQPITIPPNVGNHFVEQSTLDARQWGVKGNGLDDDTDAIQALIDQAEDTEIIFDGGEYLINGTIILKSGCKVIGKNGAIVKAGPAMTGTMLKYGRFFSLNNVDKCSITGLKFLSRKAAFQLSGWSDACIYVYNSTNSIIDNNSFEFDQPYGISGAEAVWVSGPKSKNTVIKNNIVSGLGIKYAENGASFTSVQDNKIVNAHSNALTANGNSDVRITGCQILNNLVENAGRIGIEDWGDVDGTLIEGNTISGTGKDPDQAHEGFGISAVGINTTIKNNKIFDARIYYLEIGGNHNVVAENNEISDPSGEGTGIMLNFTDKVPLPLTEGTSKVSGSSISNCDRAIQIYGSYKPVCSVVNNTVKNPKSRGISIESDAPYFNIELHDNQFIVENQTKVFRSIINNYCSLPAGSVDQRLIVRSNKVYYAPSANSGSGFDLTLLILADGAQIIDNEIIGNDVRSGGYPIHAIASNGGTANNLTIARNKISGALVDLKGYKHTVLDNNEFSQARNFE